MPTHHGGAASVGAPCSFPPVTTRLVAAQGGGSASSAVETRGELRIGLVESAVELAAASVAAGARVEVGAETASLDASSRRDRPTPAPGWQDFVLKSGYKQWLVNGS